MLAGKTNTILASTGICLMLMLTTALGTTAQARFVAKGKVEYEKKVNMHKLLDDNSWTREIKDRNPVYRITYFDLIFDGQTSLYKMGKEPAEDKWKNFWGQSGQEDNMVWNNYEQGQTKTIKQVYEKKFSIEDSLTDIEWRLTDETREIAGFDCRKAVGKMYDSLYVIAFYTDQIMVPAGPEGFHGLPGMILGLAFPRFYTTWFATKLELTEPNPADLSLPANPKAKKTTRKDMFETVRNAISWGTEEEKQRAFWMTVL